LEYIIRGEVKGVIRDIMQTKLFLYPTLAEALRSHTAVKDPEFAEKELLNALMDECPRSTHAVVFVKPGTNSPASRHWTVIPVGPEEAYKTLDEVDGSRIQVKNAADQFSVAYVVLHRAEGGKG